MTTILTLTCAIALLAWGITARKLVRVRAERDAVKQALAKLTTRGKGGRFVKVR